MPNTGKWQKFRYLRKDPSLVDYLPETSILSEYSLFLLLAKYQRVVVKPIGGGGGYGILVVSYVGGGQYQIQYGKRKKRFSGKRKTYRFIKAITRSRSYIVQRFIPFARVNDRLVDFRVMVQRVKDSAWQVTGRLAKVAYKGYVVTNPEEIVLSVETALKRSSLQYESWRNLMYHLDNVALLSAQQLSSYYPKLTIIGFDLGIDAEGNIWIIEANFSPAIYWFKQLPEKETYRRIVSFRKGKAASSGISNHRSIFDEYYYYA